MDTPIHERDPEYHQVRFDRRATVVQVCRCEGSVGRMTVILRCDGPMAAAMDRGAARLLTAYVRKAKVRLVCVEDVQGPLTSLRELPWTEPLIEEAASLPLSIVGVDSLPARSEMIRVLGIATANASNWRRSLEGAKRTLGCVIDRQCSKRGRLLLKLRADWCQGRVSPGKLAATLLELSARHRVELRHEGTLLCHKLGDRLDVHRVQAEMSELQARFAAARRLAPEFKGERVANWAAMVAPHCSVAIESGQGRPRSANEGLAADRERQVQQFMDLARVLGIDLSPYQNFLNYARHHSLGAFGRTRGENLFRDHLHMSEASLATVEDALLGPREREIASAQRALFRLEALASLELTRAALDELLEDLDAHSLTRVLRTLVDDKDHELATASREFDDHRDTLLSYYFSARYRAAHMAVEAVRVMARAGSDRALLICLGFHEHTVVRALVAKRVRCVVLLPQ